MKTFLILASWILALGVALAEDKPFGVMISAKVHDQTFPDNVAKIGKTSTTKVISELVAPKSEPPLPDLGWVMEITPEKGKEEKFVGKIVIRSTTVKIDNGEFHLATSTELTFRFSMPIDDVSHIKDLPGFGKVILKLELIDAVGNPMKKTEPDVHGNTH